MRVSVTVALLAVLAPVFVLRGSQAKPGTDSISSAQEHESGERTAAPASFDATQEAVTVDAGAALLPTVEPPPLVAWDDLADKPARWLGRKVRVRVQYASEPAAWNPYLTRFGSGQYDALQAWSDEQFPWVRSDFDAPRARVFVRKGSGAQHELVGADTYARYELTLIVREVFLDLPWAEVVEARATLDRLTEATVIHAARALELYEQRAWRLALLEFDAALGAPLPDAATAELTLRRDECAARASGAADPRETR